MAAYQAGLEMMQRGQLQGAAECFDRVSKAVPPKSKLGGEAQLQRAICLDSVVCSWLLPYTTTNDREIAQENRY